MLYYITTVKKEVWNKETKDFDDIGGQILSNHPNFPQDLSYAKDEINEDNDLYPLTRLFVPNRTCQFINNHHLKMVAITPHNFGGEERTYGVTIYFEDLLEDLKKRK
jgi:hypothetical protein